MSLNFHVTVIVVWLFLAVPCVCLQFVIVVVPNHTDKLFIYFVTYSKPTMSLDP